jgi:crotonobetainyl-CoA:carnitine CoA-transferase CaiB-like acyl-CoA transferase
VALLDGVRVLDFSTEIAGPYCTKLLADAGADVVKVEPEGGDPLRRWSASNADLGALDGALFEYLNTSKRSIVGEARSPEVERLLAGADLLVDDRRLSSTAFEWVQDRFPRLCIVSITPFGRTGPWTDRPWTEFTLQALCGSIASRGVLDREPIQAGGRLGEWIGGAYAAVAGLAALRGARRSGRGQVVDLSMFESMCVVMGGLHNALSASMGTPVSVPPRVTEIPSIEPTADDDVGFCTFTAQQFEDFLVLIEHPELIGDETLATFAARRKRREEFTTLVRDWTTKRSSAEIEELAAAMRIPVAPIGRPGTVTTIDQFADRKVYVTNPKGRFVQPRPPYRVDDAPAPPFRPAPSIGADRGQVTWERRDNGIVDGVDELPLKGVRIIDLTAFWAGPAATLTLGALGAEVIKVESIQHPDSMRFSTSQPPGTDFWWEWGSVFQGANLNKMDVTLDLTKAEGVELVLGLIAKADAVIENFTPRVLDNFGLTWERIRAANPAVVLVRMPAFGLTGPWRDRVGFAQTAEQVSGMAWMTGFRDGPPIIPKGPCDPIAGMHAAFALLACLHERDRSGRGHFVESCMVECALNVAAEIVIEHEAYGATLSRDGNRGPVSVPQGLYACAGEENWLALAIATDEQWETLRRVIGDPEWAKDPDLAGAPGRRAAHDRIDSHLKVFFADKAIEDTVEVLVAHGIPAAQVVEPVKVVDNPQLQARGFIESFDHPLVGRHQVMTMPFRFSSYTREWVRTPGPTLGQHNREVLQGLLGLSDARIEALKESQIIGNRPVG